MTSKTDMRIQDKFKLIKKIGSGAFGEIYKGTNSKSGEDVAVKLEPAKTKFPQLYYEAKLYKIFNGAVGLPKMHFFGQEGDFNVMVIDLLGPSLEELFEYCRRKFTLKTVLMLAIQMLQRIEFVHQNGFLHRDIKPDNFLIGIQKQQHVIYIIDFGLAKRYKDPRTGRHISFKDNKSLTGTARYASLNTHLGIEQARRDDLEQIGIVLMYFIRGSLPWQGLPAKTKEEKYEQIKIKKAVTSIEDLCSGYPKEFQHFLNYTRKLKFEEKPDYQQLISMFREAFVREGYDFDFMYDWNVKKAALKQRLAEQSRQQQLKQQQENQTLTFVTPPPVPKQMSNTAKQQQRESLQANINTQKKIATPLEGGAHHQNSSSLQKPPLNLNSNGQLNIPTTQMLRESGNLVMNSHTLENQQQRDRFQGVQMSPVGNHNNHFYKNNSSVGSGPPGNAGSSGPLLTGGRAQQNSSTNHHNEQNVSKERRDAANNRDPRYQHQYSTQYNHGQNRPSLRENGFKASAHRILDVPGVVPHAMASNQNNTQMSSNLTQRNSNSLQRGSSQIGNINTPGGVAQMNLTSMNVMPNSSHIGKMNSIGDRTAAGTGPVSGAQMSSGMPHQPYNMNDHSNMMVTAYNNMHHNSNFQNLNASGNSSRVGQLGADQQHEYGMMIGQRNGTQGSQQNQQFQQQNNNSQFVNTYYQQSK